MVEVKNVGIEISDLKIKTIPFKKVTVINDSVIGCQVFKEAVRPLLDKKHNLILDLNNLLGTSVANVLLGTYRKVKEYNGKIYIIVKDPEIKELLQLLHIDSFIPIFQEETEIRL